MEDKTQITIINTIPIPNTGIYRDNEREQSRIARGNMSVLFIDKNVSLTGVLL